VTSEFTVVDLAEWQTVERGDLPDLTDGDLALAAALAEGDGRLIVEELRDFTRIRSTSWVGVVRFSTFEVHVVPKYVGGNLGILQMLSFTRGLDALERAPAIRQLSTDGVHLIDLLGLLLAEEAHAIARDGLLSDYVEREDLLPVLRGRLRVLDQVTRHPSRVDVLECQFDEFETDIPENQLVAAGLDAARRYCSNDLVRWKLGRVRSLFSEACDATALDPIYAREAPDFNRRNEHYRYAHEYARLLLRRLAVNDIYAPGGSRSFAFLLDMNRLFEDFVASLLRRELEPIGLDVASQRRDRSLLEDVATGRSYGQVIPDFLIGGDSAGIRRRLPVDAKYKLYGSKKLDPADLYQLFFYAYAYRSNGPTPGRSLILYPSSEPSRTDVRVRTAAGLTGAVISAIGIDVEAILSRMEIHSPIALEAVGEITAHFLAAPIAPGAFSFGRIGSLEVDA
jgi:5-methylcytosine-specific restriction enzyme subunit McrC